MSPQNVKKIEEMPDKTFNILEDKDVNEKENTTGPRRSKRRNAFSQDPCQKVSSKEEQSVPKNPKLKSRAVKVKKAASKKSVKSEESATLNQSKLESYFSHGSQTNEDISEFSTISASTTIAHEITIGVHKSVSDETDMLTSKSPDVNYWKDLAEQRRVALEIALYENAQFADHLEVLEAENSQLKSLIKECEKVISIVNDSVA